MIKDNSSLISRSNTLDASIVGKMNVNSMEFKTFMISLVENINIISLALNDKTVGFYSKYEVLTGDKFSPNKGEPQQASKRRVIYFGALPNNTTKSVPHGLDPLWGYTFTKILCVASDTTGLTRLPIPYASSTSADIIEMYVDSTNINIKTGKDRTSFDKTVIVIEYLK